MSNQSFSLSFTAGGLYIREGVIFAQLLVDGHSWDTIKTLAFQDNIFQVTRTTSAKRLYSELAKRMTYLSVAEYTLLATGTESEQKALLWVAACRQYQFIAAFAHAIRQRYASYLRDMPIGEYLYLYEQLATMHPELTRITQLTQDKIRTVAYKMAVDADILNPDKSIRSVRNSPRFIDTISHQDDNLYFPQ